MAGLTRLELATFGVTGRRSNQLNYNPAGLVVDRKNRVRVVGGTGFEPVTPGV